MKNTVTILLLSLACCSFAQDNKEGLNELDFVIGKWKATASDSSFSSVLEYHYSPNKRMILATNYLYGKDGKLFATYEGAYLFEVDHLAYFIAGPGGETHQGKAEVKEQKVIHWAKMFPGKAVKAYKSEMHMISGQLFYFARYSNEDEYPAGVDYANPLIYRKLE